MTHVWKLVLQVRDIIGVNDMSLLDLITGGKSGEASDAQRKALAELQKVQTPSIESLTLPELQQYAVAMGMTPAQMQAFLQESNAFNNQNIDQTGTNAQIQALNQLSQVANAGAEGTPTQRAQVEQINQEAARNLAGQRGAIDQQAQARGVSPGMLQAALQSQRAGEGQQDAHMAALNAQGNAYQQALQAMAQGGALGGQLQGQQNTQANTVAQAQNAMQQFNAANQQNASANNAGMRQQANQYNTGMANQVGQQNTGLANQRTVYNAQLPQQNFQNQMQKAGGIANQYGNIANTATGQGQQQAGLIGGLIGAGAQLAGGPMAGGMQALSKGQGNAGGAPQYQNIQQYGTSFPGPLTMNRGGVVGCADGALVPGEPNIPGDSAQNDTVPAMLSPGEAVIPRSQVQQNPADVMQLLNGNDPSVIDPQDVATLLKALKMLRGGV